MSTNIYLVVLLASFFPVSSQQCTAVPLEKCGTDYSDSCLFCGTANDYDCEKCCPGCEQVVKGEYKYCMCDAAPTPGGSDTWDQYRVADMDVLSVTGGSDPSRYEKVVILLHGGGGSGRDWTYQYGLGWFGDLSGFKYVFPTTPLDKGVWYDSIKDPNCGLVDDCAYDIPSIEHAAESVAALIDYEKQLLGNDNSKIFLGGFSQGAQMSSYMQIAKLDFALGGTIIFSGFPLPPLGYMPGADPAEAKANATYYGPDMAWMVWIGSNDFIFPAKYTIDTFEGMFETLGVTDTLKLANIETGQGHTLIKAEFDAMISFIGGVFNETKLNTTSLEKSSLNS